ncbi:rho guanine nucleotide exchange factor 10 isoform X2 [Protopterus annectens]|uniref:rho guanine nucleotide exchange factor 10 isoform X2 n=1 Tax=Protopterus annectens TaxID=7888 RepID=UPI001CF93163|nr:rho guanine nucleotide exchange factor 10 isoform X2 [Protopterus annectens]
MDQEEFPPPPPEAFKNDIANGAEEEEEGEQFEFEDSGDDIPEADRHPPVPPPPDYMNWTEDHTVNNLQSVTKEGEPSPKEQGDHTSENIPSSLCSSESLQLGEACVVREEDALARWVADPANTAWMDTEVIYDDVPIENSDSATDQEDMIYDSVEKGAGNRGSGCTDYGWSSSEFESYDEQSDSECKNGISEAGLQGKKKSHISQDLSRLKDHYEKKMKGLMSNAVGAVEIQQTKLKHEQKMQKLMKAAKEGTKDGFEKTKAAVKRGRSLIKTKSFIPPDHRSACHDDESNTFIEVDCVDTEAVMTPMPEGLSQQQVVRRGILGSIVDSEKNYIGYLKQILEQYEKPLSETEPKLLSERKLKVVFYQIKEILQCHSLFQIALASRVAEWDSSEMIGDVFVASFSKSMVLDAYSEYVNNFSTAVGLIKKTCTTKPTFLEFLKHCQDTSPEGINLYSLMMKPIQRFPQFIVLLQDMLKNTPKGHQDRLPLQMALTELETLADKLSERKREVDQRCEVKQIAKSMNERYTSKLLSSGNRYLIRSDDMIETVYNEKGEIIKTKERRLFLLSDVLLCATVNTRSAFDSSGIVPAGQKYLLKWSVPLNQVEVIEFGGNEELGESNRYQVQQHVEKVAVSAKPNKVYMGPGQLYQDLENLLHDLSVVGQISNLVGNLRGIYQNLNPAVANDWSLGLKRLIMKKEEEIRAADRCRIQLQLPGKHDKHGRPVFFTAVFNTYTPAIKQSWISCLQMAKLALEEDNQLGWFCVEDEGNQIKKQKHPLLVRQVPVMMAKQQEFKVECAVYNPEPYNGYSITSEPSSVEHGFLWIGSCTNQMGQIAIVSLQNSNPKVIECFNVESRILCMVYIPEKEIPEEKCISLEQEDVVEKPCLAPTICLGMEEGSISVYKSSQGSKKVRLQHFFTPEKATVVSLTYEAPHLYAGLVNGSIAVYTKTEDGLWNSESPKVINLGVLPVKSLLVTEDTLWAASGGQIFIINTKTLTVERQLDAHQDEGMVISHIAVAGVGIWIGFTSGSSLRLFHIETLKHLQDINIATPIHKMLSGQQRVSVTSLLVCYGLLLVGTNVGMIVALPVPRLQGIPKVTGRGMVSFHSHSGPVKFLTVATVARNRRKRTASQPSQTENTDSSTDSNTIKHAEGPEVSASADKGVWLSSSVGSIAQQSDLSSSSGSLVVSQGSYAVEHSLEENVTYDLSSDLNVPLKCKASERSRKTKADSVMVISGGHGHRNLNKRSKQQRQEESVPNVMVWQIPLHFS